MKIRLLIFLLTFSGFQMLKAQSSIDSLYLLQLEQTMDSIEQIQQIVKEVQKYEHRLLRDEMAFHYNESAMLLRGLIQTGNNRSFIRHEGVFQKKDFEVQDYAVATLPLATTWALKALGVESRSKTRRMVTANALALLLAGGAVEGLKQCVNETRPNGEGNHSFPSGHSALAYASAAILEREYGHISPWITVGGYTAATATEWLRLRHNAHYINDLFTGAGIGIVATNLAYFLTDKIYGAKEINPPRLYQGDIIRLGRFLERPTSLSLLAGSELTSKRLHLDGMDWYTSTTYTAGLEYTLFFDSHWGVDVTARLATTQLKAEDISLTTTPAFTLSQYHAHAGLRYSTPLGLNTRMGFRAFGGECYTDHTRQWKAEAGAGISLEFITTKNYVTGFSVDYLHNFSHLFRDRCVINSYWKILL